MRKALLALTLLLLAGSAGCGDRLSMGSPVPEPSRSGLGPINLVRDGYAGRFRIAATVLENEHHGPQLCTFVADSLPPQCGGPDIAGWTWAGLQHESALRTKWGSYLLVGTFNGKTFKLTESAKVNDGRFNTPSRTPDFTSPCPPPVGGWRPVDPAKATDDALNAANVMVNADPDFAGLWIDEKVVPNGQQTPMNDPAKLVLNVRFTKDLARHEAEIRKVWGGALCVSKAQHTLAELTSIQQELSSEPGMTYAGVDQVTGTIQIGVFVATQTRQRELDEKYGSGLVFLTGVLEPID